MIKTPTKNHPESAQVAKGFFTKTVKNMYGHSTSSTILNGLF